MNEEFDVVFLNDAPVIRHGLASGFYRLGHRVAYLVGEEACDAPHLWDLDPRGQVAVVERWLAQHGTPDLVVFEGFTGRAPIHPAATQRARWAGTRFVYWAIEDPMWTTDVVDARGRLGPYAVAADHIATTAVECIPRYRAAGVPSSVLPFACDPDHHRPVPAVPERRADVVLVANDYPGRRGLLVERLLGPAHEVCKRRGATLAIHGHGWQDVAQSWVRRVHVGPLDYHDVPAVYSSAAIALGAEQCLNESDTQSSMRVFEVLGCGACYVGPDHRAHRAMFRPGEELFLTSSANETAALIDHLLDHPEKRARVAAAGRRACLAKHTYDHRVTALLRALADTPRPRPPTPDTSAAARGRRPS